MQGTDRTELIRQFMETMMQVKHRLMNDRENAFKKYDLTGPQVRLLYLLEDEQQLTTSQLAEHFCQSAPAITQLVDGLVKAGYLTRVPSTQDRRVIYLEFTADGRDLFQRFQADHFLFLQKVLGKLSDHDLQTMLNLYTKVLTSEE